MTDSGWFHIEARQNGTVRRITSRGGVEERDAEFLTRVTEELPRIRADIDGPPAPPGGLRYVEPATQPRINPWFER